MWGVGCGTFIVPCFFCSYIWQHIEIGYVQGMCDLLAPLLVILDDGELSVSPCPVGEEGSALLLSLWTGSGQLHSLVNSSQTQQCETSSSYSAPC